MRDVLLQRPEAGRTPEELESLAEIGVAGRAEAAPTAGDRRIHGHRRPRGRPIGARPQGLDHARNRAIAEARLRTSGSTRLPSNSMPARMSAWAMPGQLTRKCRAVAAHRLELRTAVDGSHAADLDRLLLEAVAVP